MALSFRLSSDKVKADIQTDFVVMFMLQQAFSAHMHSSRSVHILRCFMNRQPDTTLTSVFLVSSSITTLGCNFALYDAVKK